MNVEAFLTICVSLITIAIILEMYILLNNKYLYIERTMKHLTTMLERNINICDEKVMAKELKRLYSQYSNGDKKFIKFYPNIIIWIDEAIFRIDTYKNINEKLLEKEELLKAAREVLGEENLFYNCSVHQQEILMDISKLKQAENEIIVDNILNRTDDEFVRQNADNTRNRILNIVSVIIGITGILVSVILAAIK